MPKRKAQPKRTDPADRVIDAALNLATTTPWRRLSLHEIGVASGLSLAQLYALYPSKAAILAAFSRRIDGEILDGATEATGEESARDRLFDVMMRRFDALNPYKDAVVAIAGGASGDPVGALCGIAQLVRSMGWMLEAAGISSAGLSGALRAKGLAAIYLASLRVWLRDDTEDMAKTMAALDKRLARAEAWMGRLSAWRRPGREAESAPAS